VIGDVRGGDAVARQVLVLFSFVLLVVALPDVFEHGHLALAGAIVVVLLASALARHGRGALRLLPWLTSSRGPDREERCLRGAFRRHSSPDTPGRPGRPRAPGAELRPA
jgi:Family of unknown function (DUF6412)